jgi:parallel beta-helix repeat protein
MNRRDAITLLAGLGTAAPFARARAASGDVRSYGMQPAATPAANAAALQRCLNANVGAQVMIPGADADYQLTGRIIAPAGTSITLRDGARLRWVATESSGSAFLRSPTRPGIEVLGDSFRLTGNGLIIGPSPGVYVAREIGILCVGDGTGGAHRGFEISEGVEFLDWGSHAIAAQFVRDVRIVRAKISGCGYAGMQFLSCQGGQILSNVVGQIGPGTSGNAYGISCTHDSLNYDADPHVADDGRQAANPFCTGFEMAGNTVYDIPLWSGIDFHGAYECRAHNNSVYNCRNGILLQGSSGAGVDFAGEHNSVTSNTVTTKQMSGNPTTITSVARLGISVNGGKRVHHRSIVVHDNTIDGYGDSHNTSFSLQHTYTSDVEISNNRVTNWRGYGCYSAYSDGVVRGNDFGPVADSTGTACIFVAIGGNLRISGNRHVVDSGRGALFGLYINTASDAPYAIQGNDFRSATLQQYAGHGGGRLSPTQIVGGRPG